MAAQTTTPEALRGQGVDTWASGDAAAALALLQQSLNAFRHGGDTYYSPSGVALAGPVHDQPY